MNVHYFCSSPCVIASIGCHSHRYVTWHLASLDLWKFGLLALLAALLTTECKVVNKTSFVTQSATSAKQPISISLLGIQSKSSRFSLCKLTLSGKQLSSSIVLLSLHGNKLQLNEETLNLL